MSPVLAAALWSALAALSLLLGAWIALTRSPTAKVVGLTAAFGAGALLSAVAFELVEDAISMGEPAALALSLAAGAAVYYLASKRLGQGTSEGDASVRGRALLLGAALDGVPESFILGIAIASGGGVSLAFFFAVLLSNLPEGMASASELSRDPNMSKGRILRMWLAIVGVCAIAGAVGALAASEVRTGAYAQAFAAGALLTMLVDDLIPEARERGTLLAGPVAVVGFAVAFALHQIGG